MAYKAPAAYRGGGGGGGQSVQEGGGRTSKRHGMGFYFALPTRGTHSRALCTHLDSVHPQQMGTGWNDNLQPASIPLALTDLGSDWSKVLDVVSPSHGGCSRRETGSTRPKIPLLASILLSLSPLALDAPPLSSGGSRGVTVLCNFFFGAGLATHRLQRTVGL